MTITEAIQYLQPIADSSCLPRYSDALNVAIRAMEELETTRSFIHEHGLDFALIGAWEKHKNHIREATKKVHGRLQRVYEDSLGWVDRCSCCKTVMNGEEIECPVCLARMDGE